MSTDSYETAFLVSTRMTDGLSSPVMTIELRAAKVLADGRIRNFMDSAWPREPLAELVVSAQCDNSSATGSYGWKVSYRESYSVDLERAAEMLKVLRSIDRGMDKLRSEFGYPDTFAEYVARVAKVLKVRTFGWSADSSASGWSYDDHPYRMADVDGMRSHLDTLQAEFLRDAAIS